jgi:cyclic beta-1,2-glucan synthetase
MVYRRQNKDGTTTRYDITVENPTGASRGVAQIELDGVALPPSARLIPLAEDCVSHAVRVTLGSSRE